jgi:hypothetical protein
VAGGRSTHGIRTGVLSWLIEEGAVDSTEVSGLPVAVASRYNDDEPGAADMSRRSRCSRALVGLPFNRCSVVVRGPAIVR